MSLVRETFFRMTGNMKKNQKFEIESSDPTVGQPSEPTSDPTLESTSGPTSGPSGLYSGPRIDESSVMVSGMVPIYMEVEERPIWINPDANSKRAFRPSKVKFEVSTYLSKSKL